MSKRLQDLDEQLVLNNNAYMLVKQNTPDGDRDFRIPVNTFLQNTLQTSNVGTSVGDLITLVAGTGGAALPAVSGEFLTNLPLPIGNISAHGIVKLSDSLVSNAGISSGIAATPSVIKLLNETKASLSGANFGGTVKSPNFHITGSGGNLVIDPDNTGLGLSFIDSALGKANVGLVDRELRLRGSSLIFRDWNAGNPINRPVFHSGNVGGSSNGINAQFLGNNNSAYYAGLSRNEVVTGLWNFTQDLLLSEDLVVEHGGGLRGILSDTLTEINIATIDGTNRLKIGQTSGTHGDLVLQTTASTDLKYNKGGIEYKVLHEGTTLDFNSLNFTNGNGTATLGAVSNVTTEGSLNLTTGLGTNSDSVGYIINGRSAFVSSATSFEMRLKDLVTDQTMIRLNTAFGSVDLYHNNAPVLETVSGGINVNGSYRFNIGPVLSEDTSDWLLIDPNDLYTNGTKINSKLLQVTGDFHVGTNGTTLKASSSELTYKGNKVFHAGNDGAGSGLDADTVRGFSPFTFMRSDVSSSTVGALSGGSIFSGYDSSLTYAISCSNWFRSNGDTGWRNDTHGGGIYMTDGTWVRVFNNKKFYVTNTANDSINTEGGITAAGNITAFSDKRVKTDLQVIPEALDKVCKLTGYTYERTDGEFKRQTGVIAQEVLEVLPEAVESYTVEDEERLGVSYGNMVGLLIESIKELKAEIDELKQGL